jgi:hypothetical protein
MASEPHHGCRNLQPAKSFPGLDLGLKLRTSNDLCGLLKRDTCSERLPHKGQAVLESSHQRLVASQCLLKPRPRAPDSRSRKRRALCALTHHTMIGTVPVFRPCLVSGLSSVQATQEGSSTGDSGPRGPLGPMVPHNPLPFLQPRPATALWSHGFCCWGRGRDIVAACLCSSRRHGTADTGCRSDGLYLIRTKDSGYHIKCCSIYTVIQ